MYDLTGHPLYYGRWNNGSQWACVLGHWKLCIQKAFFMHEGTIRRLYWCKALPVDALVTLTGERIIRTRRIFVVLQIRLVSSVNENGIYGCASRGASIELPWPAVAESMGGRTQWKWTGYAQSQGPKFWDLPTTAKDTEVFINHLWNNYNSLIIVYQSIFA